MLPWQGGTMLCTSCRARPGSSYGRTLCSCHSPSQLGPAGETPTCLCFQEAHQSQAEKWIQQKGMPACISYADRHIPFILQLFWVGLQHLFWTWRDTGQFYLVAAAFISWPLLPPGRTALYTCLHLQDMSQSWTAKTCSRKGCRLAHLSAAAASQFSFSAPPENRHMQGSFTPTWWWLWC